MNFLMNTLFLFFATLFAFVAAAPLSLQTRDVYDPHVTYPLAGTVWKVGERHNVTWDTSDAPQQITNPIGQIVLSQGDALLPYTLASNFSILDGSAEVTVPTVDSGNYSLILFGDSGNHSPVFEITN